jgi:hypothetical protein
MTIAEAREKLRRHRARLLDDIDRSNRTTLLSQPGVDVDEADALVDDLRRQAEETFAALDNDIGVELIREGWE